jgi:hypothetical protein
LPFCQLAILPAFHFASLPFCQFAILPAYYFIKLPYHCCLPFYQLDSL